MRSMPDVRVLAILLACVGSLADVRLAQGQSPPEELDRSWVNVCAGAEPGSEFAARCAEILNSGPGSGNRRSEAALGNNVGVSAAPGRQGQAGEDREVFDFAGISLFVTFDAGWADRSGGDYEAGYGASRRGVLAGVDRFLSDRAVVGLAGRFAAQSTEFDGGAGDLETTEMGLLLYQNLSITDRTVLDSYLGAARMRLESTRSIGYSLVVDAGLPTERTISVAGAATADTRGNQFTAGTRLARDLFLGALTAAPSAGVDFVTTGIDPYAETDGIGLALAYEGQSTRSLTSVLGLSLSASWSRAWGVLTPELLGELVHEFEDDSRVITTRFVQDSGAYPLLVRTEGPDRDYARLSGSLSAILPNGLVMFADYAGTLGHAWLEEHAASLGVRLER